MGADRSRFGKIIEDLENSHLLGDDVYPKTINDAYNLLCHWKQDVRNNTRISDGAITPASVTELCLIIMV